jgi:hypothetical protein
MKTTTAPTKVIFRTWRTTGEVIALFPEIPHDRHGHHCESYMHVGQHSGASPDLSDYTRPSTPDEIAPLRRELERIGYVLDVRRKVTAAMHRSRHEAAKR